MIEDMKHFVMGMPAAVSDDSRVTVSSLTMGDCRTIAAWMTPRPLAEWSEEDGDVLWWKLDDKGRPTEAPWVGTPNDCGLTVQVNFDVTMRTHIDPEGEEHEFVVSRNVGGFPGYHTHWTPLPKVVTP